MLRRAVAPRTTSLQGWDGADRGETRPSLSMSRRPWDAVEQRRRPERRIRERAHRAVKRAAILLWYRIGHRVGRWTEVAICG